jgi:RNA polymerase sigma-70 factor (ECF subfamily)
LARRKRFTDDELPDGADPAPGPAALAELNDEARTLRAAIEALPEKYRAVITLYHLQGRQYEEIAQVLDLPMGTVKTHLFRAKDLLRKTLTTQ